MWSPGAGSYSYVAVGASGRTYEALAKPVRRRLLFAGEHTSMEVTATLEPTLPRTYPPVKHCTVVAAMLDALAGCALSYAHRTGYKAAHPAVCTAVL